MKNRKETQMVTQHDHFSTPLSTSSSITVSLKRCTGSEVSTDHCTVLVYTSVPHFPLPRTCSVTYRYCDILTHSLLNRTHQQLLPILLRCYFSLLQNGQHCYETLWNPFHIRLETELLIGVKSIFFQQL